MSFPSFQSIPNKIFSKGNELFNNVFSTPASGLDYVTVPAKEGLRILCETARVVRDFAIFAFKWIDAQLSKKDDLKQFNANLALGNLKNQALCLTHTCHLSAIICKALFVKKKKMAKAEAYANFYAKTFS